MRIATNFAHIALEVPALLTIGTFDGVHRGHCFLLEQAQQRCIEHGYGLVIVSFDPCPAVVLRPGLRQYQLTTARQKLQQLEALSPAMVVVLPFTPDLASLSADEFMERLEHALKLREMWLGEDFGFGRDRSGNLGLLVERGRRAGFALHVVSRRTDGADSISSSRIRQALREGDVEGVIPLLGRPFALDLDSAFPGSGYTDPGDRLYRAAVPAYLALPASGVYAALIRNADGQSVPTAVSVEVSRETCEVFIWAPAAVPVDTIEFITRLQQEPVDASDWLALSQRAAERLVAWERPVFPASGNY